MRRSAQARLSGLLRSRPGVNFRSGEHVVGAKLADIRRLTDAPSFASRRSDLLSSRYATLAVTNKTAPYYDA